jgi:hypothetical protein
MRNSLLFTAFGLVQGLQFAQAQFDAPEVVDFTPPPPQPNDIGGTVNGCANAILSHDDSGDGVIRRNEFLDYVNNVADLLCIPPRPNLDLELQTVFVSIACLCLEREAFGPDCCTGDNAGLYLAGAEDVPSRTEDEDSYLRAACLMTQAVLGPDQCRWEPVTIAPGAIPGVVVPPAGTTPLPEEEEDEANMLWLLLLLLFTVFCLICCCCYKKNEEEEEWEVTVTEEKFVKGPDEEIGDRGLNPMPEEPEVRSPLAIPSDELPVDEGVKSLAVPPVASGPKPAVPPGNEEDADAEKRRLGEMEDDEEDEEAGRRLGGQGELPPPPNPIGVRLRHVEKEKPPGAEYEYPERELVEAKIKREDSGQILDHYEPDGGVFIPERAKKGSVEMPKPHYERQKPPEPVYIDPRKQRKQMGLGDGEVWDALNEWEDEQEKHGTLQ